MISASSACYLVYAKKKGEQKEKRNILSQLKLWSLIKYNDAQHVFLKALSREG